MTTPNDTAKLDHPAQNTDRELWREPHPDPPGDYYANSIHVTAQGGIGINVGGTVVVKTLAQWHALVVEPDGQLRANLSNDAIQSLLDTSLLDTAKEWKGKTERLEAELAEARQRIQKLEAQDHESHELCCRLASKIGVERGYSEKMTGERDQAREQRNTLVKALEKLRDMLSVASPVMYCEDCFSSPNECGCATPVMERFMNALRQPVQSALAELEKEQG